MFPFFIFTLVNNGGVVVGGRCDTNDGNVVSFKGLQFLPQMYVLCCNLGDIGNDTEMIKLVLQL